MQGNQCRLFYQPWTVYSEFFTDDVEKNALFVDVDVHGVGCGLLYAPQRVFVAPFTLPGCLRAKDRCCHSWKIMPRRRGWRCGALPSVWPKGIHCLLKDHARADRMSAGTSGQYDVDPASPSDAPASQLLGQYMRRGQRAPLEVRQGSAADLEFGPHVQGYNHQHKSSPGCIVLIFRDFSCCIQNR